MDFYESKQIFQIFGITPCLFVKYLDSIKIYGGKYFGLFAMVVWLLRF